MVSRFLLLPALSCCVCGLEVNVAHSSYQAEEKQNITLEWTFTPKPDPSLKHLLVHCGMSFQRIFFRLFHFDGGVEISESQSEEFSGRVQCDKDVLREGRIRLHVSSLRTEDSGRYTCLVNRFTEEKADICRLNVTAARNQTHSTPEPEKPDSVGLSSAARNQTHSTPEPEKPGSGRPARIGLYWGLGLTAAVGFLVVYILIIHPWIKKRFISDVETDCEKSLAQHTMDKHQLCVVPLIDR